MLDCFDGYQPESTRDLSRRIKNCNNWHKQRMVKIGCARGYPEQLSSGAREQIRISLLQTVRSHRTLKEFFRPYLDESDAQVIFYEDRIETLKHRNNKLKLDRASFEKQVWELAKNDEKRQQSVLVLDERCRELEHQLECYKQGDVETAYKRRQQQLEETLKAQNDLIDDLGRRLSDSSRENEILKELNRSLECELKKTSAVTASTKTELDGGKLCTAVLPVIPQPLLEENVQEAPAANVQQQCMDEPIQIAIYTISRIRADVSGLVKRVYEFFGQRSDREFVYLRESLTRYILKLNNIEPKGHHNIEEKRQKMVNEITQLLTHLESSCSV